MEELLKQLEAAEAEVSRIRTAINKFKDGYIYVTSLQIYGTEYWDVHTNQFPVDELYEEYYDGYNGILTIYTNNPKSKTKRKATVMTIDELKALHYSLEKRIDAL
jgi:hypothetical protein